MKTDFTFSVITPCFNAEKYIAETIENVLTQKGPFKIQYIVLDAGSTDKTVEILEYLKQRIDSGHYDGYCRGIDFTFISEPDDGMYDAISKGLTLINGDICSYINSDDFYLPNAFKTVLSIFSFYTTINWLTGIPNVYNSFGANFKRVMPFSYRQDFIRKGVYGRELNHIQQESVFWRSSLNKNINLKTLSTYKYAGDYYIWHEFSKSNKLWIVDSIISGFRTHDLNKSNDISFYQKEFDSIISESISFRDKLSLSKHKFLWRSDYESKRKHSDSIMSVIRPQLLENFIKLETGNMAESNITTPKDQKNQEDTLLSVVIGSYNRLSMLTLCIDAVRSELVDIKYEIIVIDGGSTDGTIEWLITQKDIITIIQHNRGEWQGKAINRKPWSYFMNLGFKSASGKFLCMLSDDSLIIPGAIKNGISLFKSRLSKNEKIGAVAFYFRDYPIRNKYAVAVNVGNIYVNHGLYLKEALEEVGYADEDYHFYFADTDLVLKIKSKGYSCIASQDSFVEHYFEATPEIRSTNNDARKEQDRLRLINKWKGSAYPEDDYRKYIKTVGFWDYHPTGYTDKYNTIQKLIKACND